MGFTKYCTNVIGGISVTSMRLKTPRHKLFLLSTRTCDLAYDTPNFFTFTFSVEYSSLILVEWPFLLIYLTHPYERTYHAPVKKIQVPRKWRFGAVADKAIGIFS